MKDWKPFNLEHAKAGAPFCTLADESVEILKWDMKYGNCPLLGIVGDEQHGARWAVDGTPNGASPSNYKLIMTPLGHIDGKPVFVGDEIELKCMAKPDEWKRVKAEPSWAGTWTGECARWPAPAKQYPVTWMTFNELHAAYARGRTDGDVIWSFAGCEAVANAALRHAVESGQLLIPTVAQAYEIGRKEAIDAFLNTGMMQQC